MKSNVLLLFLVALLSISTYARQKTAPKIPTAVMNAFKAKFPKVVKPTWEVEKADEYEAEFTVNGTAQSAKFDKTGKWLKTETDIKTSELPKAVTQSVAKHFTAFKITEASKVESAKYGNGYEVEIMKAKELYDVLLNAKGEVLHKEAETAREDDKN